MKLNRLHMATLAAMLGAAALVGCKKKEEPVAPPPVATDTVPGALPTDTAPVVPPLRSAASISAMRWVRTCA